MTAYTHNSQILDLRERGSETVSHSEGTGIAAFTTKSRTQQQCSPFTPPGHRSKGGYSRRSRGAIGTIGSNVLLSTLGSIPPDIDLDSEQDMVEMDDIRLGLGLDLGSLSTAVGGDDGEPLSEGESHSATPAPAYTSLETGFRGGQDPSLEESRAYGIRVDVERATSTM
jgi:hypothetical protein